jgi:hypothetical protein
VGIVRRSSTSEGGCDDLSATAFLAKTESIYFLLVALDCFAGARNAVTYRSRNIDENATNFGYARRRKRFAYVVAIAMRARITKAAMPRDFGPSST